MSRYEVASHRIYMTFFARNGWQVQFLESDLKTPLPKRFIFQDPEKIRELARRGEALSTQEDRQLLEAAIQVGRGGMFLRLTPQQYSNLVGRSQSPARATRPAPVPVNQPPAKPPQRAGYGYEQRPPYTKSQPKRRWGT